MELHSRTSRAPRRHTLLSWMAVVTLSGATCLIYEVVWMRRLGLILGGSAPAAATTIAAFMAGLAIGAIASRQLPRRPARVYAVLEIVAAAWALAFPYLLTLGHPMVIAIPEARWWLSAALLLLPATAMGATWPVLAREVDEANAVRFYAANTGGAVLGVLATTFVLLPGLGVRGSELAGAGLGVFTAALAWSCGPPSAVARRAHPKVYAPLSALLAAAATGFAVLGLEVVWMRLAAVGLGATVQTVGLVLATFLATMGLGAAAGGRWPKEPGPSVPLAMATLGTAALAGAACWGLLPYGIGLVYGTAGPPALLPATAVAAVVIMGGAPIASGWAFSLLLRSLGSEHAGSLYAANTLGSIAGALLGGLWALPTLEARGAMLLFAGASATGAALLARKPWPLAPVLLLALFLPGWDGKLFAVGVHLRVSDFAEHTPHAIQRFAEEGWDLLLYDHGTTAAVAVGRSARTGNTWLSINGKVDASTGDDMPTQQLSGQLPVRAADDAENLLVVGLASGVTAGAALAEPGVQSLTVVELEPVVVRASHFFDHVNGRPLRDPRTRLVIDDARAFLQRPGPHYNVIVSEPSNPWITGVSSLFTLEYWETARSRLAPGGVICQWMQLYGLGREEMRGIVRTFITVFPDTWLFVTVPGSDVLLLGGSPTLPPDLPVEPVLGPDALRRLAGDGWMNTDDRPRVEWRAPAWLHYDTGPSNEAYIRSFASAP